MKRMFTKSKTKADILSMLDRMIAQHGDAMSIPMLRVDQSDHLKLYTCALTTGFLQAMICRLPRSLENPEGIQRALVMKKVSEIEERLSSGPYGFPNAIVITLRCQDSPYITVAPLESRTSDSSGIVLLTVALHRYREHIAACAADEAGYLLAPEQELLGYMIDGHHRTEGAYAAGKLDYPFLTGVYLDLDLRKMAASFAEINCNQEKPSAIHTNAIRNLSGLMSDRENTAFDLMDELNGRAGLFHDRIKMFDGPRARSLPRAYVNSSKMQKLLEHWLEINLQNGFNYTTFSARVEAIETYFSAWNVQFIIMCERADKLRRTYFFTQKRRRGYEIRVLKARGTADYRGNVRKGRKAGRDCRACWKVPSDHIPRARARQDRGNGLPLSSRV